MRRLSLPSSILRDNKKFLVVISILFVALFVDLSLVKLSNLMIKGPESAWRIYSFFIISILSILGQFLILDFVKQKSSQMLPSQHLHLDPVHNIVKIVQCVITSILVFVMLQTALNSYYSTFAITSAVTLSYGLSAAMMIFLSQRFMSWFVSDRNFTVLLYGLSSISITVNAFFSLFFILSMSSVWPAVIRRFYASSTTYLESESLAYNLSFAVPVSSVLSFTLTWAATAMLLRHHSDRLGKTKYWIIISIPLAYFLSQFLNLFLSLFAPLLQSITFGVVLVLIFTLSKPVGGILFGVAFFTLAKNIRNDQVKNYLILSAYGFVLLFISNQASSLVYHPYPAFGLVTISFMGLSSYLILTGIYASAISISQDSKLRQSIRTLAIEELKLLDSIGTAQMETELEKRVLKITKENKDKMIETTGLSSSLEEEDIKKYLDDVMQEIHKETRKTKEA